MRPNGRFEAEMPIAVLEELLRSSGRRLPPPTLSLLAIDPGHTTGIALLSGLTLTFVDQIPLSQVPANITALLSTPSPPNLAILEGYRIYAHKASQHIGSDVPTLQLIGVIKHLLATASPTAIPVFEQSASQGKAFVTNERLREWGYWQGHTQKHAHDAIRHALTYYLFSKRASDLW